MITPYFGEFLLTTIPLELSLNYCSHKCAYCFANLNQPNRKAAAQSIVNQLAEIDTRKTLASKLLALRYPILISNKVDPFAQSNYRLTLQILELLAALKIPVAFQTKGGKGIDEAMDLIGPSCFYWSLTHSSEDTAARIEPGAPSMTERFRQIAKVRARGHHVWAGVNPMNRAWIPDVKEFAQRLADNGIRHVWSEMLHLSRDQVAAMNDLERAAITPEVIGEAMQRNCAPESFTHMMDFIDACRANGISFACKHWPEASTVMDAYAALYPKRFPTLTEFTNLACRTMKPGDEISFADFRAFCDPMLPDIHTNECFHYVASCSRVLAKDISRDSVLDYAAVIKIIWTRPEHRMIPSRSLAFKKTDKVDSDGLPIRYYTGRKLERR